jgi:hypothetical protein
MADKMDIDAVNGEKQTESVGPASTLPPERSTLPDVYDEGLDIDIRAI